VDVWTSGVTRRLAARCEGAEVAVCEPSDVRPMYSESFSSVGDYYRNGPYHCHVRERRSAGRTPVDLVRVAQPAGSFPDPPVPALSIMMLVRGVINTRFCLGDKPFNRVQTPGTFVVAPPDTACDYLVDAPHEFLVVGFPASAASSLLEEATGARLACLGALHADTHRDAFLEHLCHRLFQETETDHPLGGLFADHALVMLISALLRLARQTPKSNRDSLRLGTAVLRRVLDYIEDRLPEAIALADLAEVARVSEFHFARLFKQSVGEPPHHYLIRRRIERAKLLIRQGRWSLAQIAAAVGFADQSHLGRHFKRFTGLTPSQFLDSPPKQERSR
jgi:AraC family transcriptional regulator